MTSCAYCHGPVTGHGLQGRPWPGRPAATYCCYGCLSLGEQQAQIAATPREPIALGNTGLKLGIGLLVAGQSMIFGLALNVHDDVSPTERWLTQGIILCGTLLVMALLGPPLFRTAWHELRTGRLTIEALFVITLTGAMVASLQAFITGHGAIYFEVVSILLVVYTLGKLIGARSRSAALQQAQAWAGQFDTCRLTDQHGRTRTVSVTEIRPGDWVEIRPGESITVDGVIRHGTGFISEATITGEPFPTVRRPGDQVLAGSVSHDARFVVEATTPGTNRQLDRILSTIAEARNQPVSFQKQADALNRWFLPLVISVSLSTFIYWSWWVETASWETGLFNAMAVLLVACPCVIGLATPIIIWTVIGRLAERGLIIRSADVIEKLSEIDTILLDKTGTVTEDRLVLVDMVTILEGIEREQLIEWLAIVQECVNHPIARAFAALSRNKNQQRKPNIVSLNVLPGCGIETEFVIDGIRHQLTAGTPQWITSLCGDDGDILSQQLLAQGHRIDIALDGRRVMIAILAERVHDTANEMLDDCRQMGLNVEIITGDATRKTTIPGIKTHWGLSPIDKVDIIQKTTAAGSKVLMVGDGINDAAALANAHIGIALANGTDLAITSAHAVLYHTDLRVITWAVALSRMAVKAVRRNLLRAAAYNVVGITLAACGWLHPIAAALLMVVSSLSLVLSATRIGTRSVECTPISYNGHNSYLLAAKAIIHAIAFVAQGLLIILLIEELQSPIRIIAILNGFILVSIITTRWWYQWQSIPHWLDMTYSMLTFGNLGMLIGWWWDLDFTTLHEPGCRECITLIQEGLLHSSGMWVGMLILANVAMVFLSRHNNHGGQHHLLAMYTGGNVGMVLGMISGGWLAYQFTFQSLVLGFSASLLGMMLGMIVGMLTGTILLEYALDLVTWCGSAIQLTKYSMNQRAK